MLPKRYPAISVIVEIYRVLAATVALAAVIGLVFSFVFLEADSTRYLVVVLSIGVGVVGTITFLAASESIKVFIDIEENTRLTAELLRRMRQ